MKIAVIGTGNVGRTLGKRWTELGHEVIFGSRNPKDAPVASKTIKEAVGLSDVILLAVPWPAAKNVISELGNVLGKILIDATNPLKPNLEGLEADRTTSSVEGRSSMSVRKGHSSMSAGEQVAQWAKGAKVVKAFNMIGSAVMGNPVFGKERALLLICGDDTEAKKKVADLGTQMGFEVIDAGTIQAARFLEQVAMFWISLALKQGLGFDFALKLLRRHD